MFRIQGLVFPERSSRLIVLRSGSEYKVWEFLGMKVWGLGFLMHSLNNW